MGGTHEVLFPRLVGAIRGESVEPVELSGGTVNYKLMDAATAWIAAPSPKSERRMLDLLHEMRRIGHLSLEGPKGVACEQGAPAAHWTFNVGSVAGVLKWAHARGHVPLFAAALDFMRDEAWLDLAHTYNGRCILPAPRVKDEKGQGPLDGYRDVFVALVLGDRVKKSARYWSQPGAIAVATVREVDWVTGGELFRELRKASMPRLYLPIRREHLQRERIDEGTLTIDAAGFRSWIERTPEAERAMGRDGCNWVSAGPDGLAWGYDWEAPPWQA